MHRSGTSALAGLLRLLGAQLPASLMDPHESNARGFFESTRIRDFNDLVLSEAGSSWRSLVVPDREWLECPGTEALRMRAAEVVRAEFGDAPLIVLKDPRICRLMPFWRIVLSRMGYTLVCLHTHRNPLDVIASLQRRYAMEPDLVLKLWLQHQLLAESSSRGLVRYFTSFDRIVRSRGALHDFVATACGLPSPEEAEEKSAEFLSADLINHFAGKDDAFVAGALPEAARTAFSVFETWADQGERSEERKTLDLLQSSLMRDGWNVRSKD